MIRESLASGKPSQLAELVRHGDRVVLRDFLDLFVTTSERRLPLLRGSLEAGDLDEVTALAHTLVGSVGVLGVEELTNELRTLEAAARSRDLVETRQAAAAALPMLELACGDAKSWIADLQRL